MCSSDLLIAVFAILMGAGFGMSWTFILRRATGLAAPDDRDRLASALPTVQRLGYAIGAALAGIIANASGFTDGIGAETARAVSANLFTLMLPLAALGLVAAARFSRVGT